MDTSPRTISREGTTLSLENVRRLHFIGIGGVGMSGIARLCMSRGFSVSGSDLKQSALTRRLAEAGARICLGHVASNVADAELIVISSAIPPENDELKEAASRGLPVHRRAEVLAWLMRDHEAIAIGGAHGKTTTTSITSHLLEVGGLDPVLVVGGEVNALGANVREGKGRHMVVEADESDGSFLLLPAKAVIVTNIDDDHLDHWQTMERMEAAYCRFIEGVGADGLAVLCVDDPRLGRLAPRIAVPKITYGFSEGARVRGLETVHDGSHSVFVVEQDGSRSRPFKLSIPGRHNALNALGAIAMARHVGVHDDAIARGLETFTGVKRRFQLIGEARGVRVFDDYAHHPTEVRAMLQSARLSRPKRLIALFQPHRYSRTELLASAFAGAFAEADVVVLLPIYSAGEKMRDGVSSSTIYQKLASEHPHVIKLSPKPSLEGYIPLVCSQLEPGDWLFTVGAGDVNQMGAMILAHLEREGNR